MRERKELKLNIEMLTPLWTGGINGSFDEFHATGIIGSLRWWYESIIRGSGGKACDLENNACTLNEKKYKDLKGLPQKERLEKSGLCDACQLFGATGWKRRFSLKILNKPANNINLSSILNIKPESRNKGWFLPKGYMGLISISLTGNEDVLLKVLALFRFLEKHGGIGAKQQLGYGLFRIRSNVNTKKFFESINQDSNTEISDLPDLRTFTFFEFGFTPKNDNWWKDIPGLKEISSSNQIVTLPISPIIKNHLRFGQEWSSGSLPQWFFDKSIGDDRIRIKIGISWAFKEGDEWKIRGWFYIPGNSEYRDKLRYVLQKKLWDKSFWLGMVNLKATNCKSSNISLLPLNTPWDIHNSKEVLYLINESQGK